MSHVVYHCYDADDRLLYIGCTQDLTARMYVHECDTKNPASRELIARTVSVTEAEYATREEALRVERESIAAEAPLLNTHHNLGRGMKNLPPLTRQGLRPEQSAQMAEALAGFAKPRTTA